MARRDAILCVSDYAGRFASAELHAGDAKYCVSTKFLHLAPPSLKPNYHFLDSFLAMHGRQCVTDYALTIMHDDEIATLLPALRQTGSSQ
jgi:hypothetical protein